MSRENQSLHRGLWALLIGLAVFAAICRFIDLGGWPLATDEFYIAQSVRSILEHGVPVFPCGGYYTRGMIYQYVLAAVQSLVPMDVEVSFRIVTVLLQLAALPPLFFLAKRVSGGNTTFALTVVAVFLLSLWEYEFSRFIRMYTPFQTLFVYYLYCFYRMQADGENRYFWPMLLLSLLGSVLYEGAVFLLALNFLPLLHRPLRPYLGYGLAALAVFGFGFLFITGKIVPGPPLSLPADVIAEWGTTGRASPIDLPKLLLIPMWQAGLSWLFVLPFTVTVFAAWQVLRANAPAGWPRFAFLFFLVCGLLHQFGLAVETGIFLVLFGLFSLRDWQSRAGVTVLAAMAVCGLFWFLFGLASTSWYGLVEGAAEQPLKKIIVLFAKYPDIYTKVIYQWQVVMPMYVLLVALPVTVAVWISRREPAGLAASLRMLLALWFLLVLITGVLNQLYYSSRYTFFLMPLMIVIWVLAWTLIAGRLRSLPQVYQGAAVTALVLLSVFVAEDFSLAHMLNPTEVRRHYTGPKDDHFYFRVDYRAPAQYVNRHAAVGDTVVTTIPPVFFYLNKLDYFFQDYRSLEFPAVSACGGEREKWTHARLLYRTENVLSLIRTQTTPLWLIVWSPRFAYPSEIEKILHEKYADRLRFKGSDGWIDVYEITPGP